MHSTTRTFCVLNNSRCCELLAEPYSTTSHTMVSVAADVREARVMLSLSQGNHIIITSKLKTDKTHFGCIKCCHAPMCCWPCAASPCTCCMLPKSLIDQLEDSKYVYIRENSLEWNDPGFKFARCNCLIPVNCCKLVVEDNVNVVYFDNPLFSSISECTPCCNSCTSYICGGRGQQVRMAETFCCGMCIPGKNGCCCCPSCCPNCCIQPFIVSHTIFVEDASSAVAEIKAAHANARKRMGMD